MEKQRIEMICEKNILSAQERLVMGTNSLLEMNPAVEALVAQKKKLRAALKVAAHPAVRAALLAALGLVEVKMKLLRARQLMVIQTEQGRATLTLWRMDQALRREAAEIGNHWNGIPLSANITKTAPRIHLRPNFVDPELPVYKEPPNLALVQALHTHVRIQGRSLFPQWLKFLNLNRKPINWQETCSSHPHKGGLQWQSRMGRVKSL